MSRIKTVWRSVSKNTLGAPPVYAALWNTGLVWDRVMKVSAALTSAEVRSASVAGASSRTAWVTACLLGSVWPTYGRGFHLRGR
jgi:hypothetical protein